MIFSVLQDIEIETPAGITALASGQIIHLQEDDALELWEDEVIRPVGYRLYSDILQAYLWVTEDAEGMKALRGQGITEAIYTGEEMHKLRGVSKDDLRAIHSVKDVFDKGIVKEVHQKGEHEKDKRHRAS